MRFTDIKGLTPTQAMQFESVVEKIEREMGCDYDVDVFLKYLKSNLIDTVSVSYHNSTVSELESQIDYLEDEIDYYERLRVW